MICGVRVRFIGTEHISKTPVLYVSKHQSALETLALATIINNSACVVKKILISHPYFRLVFMAIRNDWYQSQQRAKIITKKCVLIPIMLLNKAEMLPYFPKATRFKSWGKAQL